MDNNEFLSLDCAGRARLLKEVLMGKAKLDISKPTNSNDSEQIRFSRVDVENDKQTKSKA